MADSLGQVSSHSPLKINMVKEALYQRDFMSGINRSSGISTAIQRERVGLDLLKCIL